MNARAETLARIRAAVGESTEPRTIARDYRTESDQPPGSSHLVELFEERLRDYGAHVSRSTADGISSWVAECLADARCVGDLVVPDGIDRTWLAHTSATVDDGSLTSAGLSAAGAVLTACAVAVAETGTIVLDASPDQGRRAISLVPDVHLCVVGAAQIVDDVPDALRLLDPCRPLTFISGGSATSDIELQRVEGVHGPRHLMVLIVDAAPAAPAS